MTATTVTIGGTAVAFPGRDGIRIEKMPIAAAARMLDGTLRQQYRATKAKITVAWEGLSSAERTTLLNAWLTCFTAARTLILPDGASYSVMAGKNSWQESPWFNIADTSFINVTITFEEV